MNRRESDMMWVIKERKKIEKELVKDGNDKYWIEPGQPGAEYEEYMKWNDNLWEQDIEKELKERIKIRAN
jgi:hypothetical protein